MEDYGQQGSKYGYGTTRKDSRGSEGSSGHADEGEYGELKFFLQYFIYYFHLTPQVSILDPSPHYWVIQEDI